jgi:preprotein translocase subunit YajC
MQLIFGTLAAAGLFATAPAVGQGQTMKVTPVVQTITAGMQVTDPSGGAVGTVKAVQGTNLVIQTDKHEVLLPRASFTISGGKLLIGMRQAQLDAQIEKSLAVSNASIVAGATVKGTGGTPVGTIDSVADGKVTITLQGGKKIAVPQQGVRGNADGTVTIGYSAAQLEALVQGSGSTTSGSASSPDSASK